MWDYCTVYFTQAFLCISELLKVHSSTEEIKAQKSSKGSYSGGIELSEKHLAIVGVSLHRS